MIEHELKALKGGAALQREERRKASHGHRETLRRVVELAAGFLHRQCYLVASDDIRDLE